LEFPVFIIGDEPQDLPGEYGCLLKDHFTMNYMPMAYRCQGVFMVDVTRSAVLVAAAQALDRPNPVGALCRL